MLERIMSAWPFVVAFGCGWLACLLYLYRSEDLVQVVETENWEQVPDEIEFIIREAERQTAG